MRHAQESTTIRHNIRTIERQIIAIKAKGGENMEARLKEPRAHVTLLCAMRAARRGKRHAGNMHAPKTISDLWDRLAEDAKAGK